MKFKIFLGSSFFGVATLLSACGTGRFDQIDDGKIKLAVVTSPSAASSLQTLLDQYNNTKAPADYPVEVVSLDSTGSYTKGKFDTQKRLAAKDKNNFYNLTFNYPDLVSSLAINGMELNLDGVNVSNFEQSFLDFNKNISGVRKPGIYALPATMSGEVLVLNGPVLHYILNSAKKKDGTESKIKTAQLKTASTQAEVKGTMTMASDEQTTKLWTNIQNAAKENADNGTTEKAEKTVSASSLQLKNTNKTTEGTLKIGTDDNTKNLWKKIEDAAKTNGEKGNEKQEATQSNASASLVKLDQKNTSQDKTQNTQTSDDEIKKSWGEYKEVEGGLKGYEFKADVFESWEKLNDFAVRVAKSFSKVSEEKKSGSDIQGVFGIGSLENALYTASFAAGGGDYNNFLFNIKKGRADFSNFFNHNSKTFQSLRDIFNSFKPLIDQKGLINNKHFDTPVNNYAKFHQLAFYVSSTARFPYSFAKDNVKRLIIGKRELEVNPKSMFAIKKENGNNGNSNLLGKVALDNNKSIELYENNIPNGKTDAILIKNQTLISALKNPKQTKSSQRSSQSTNTQNDAICYLAFNSKIRPDDKDIFLLDKFGEKFVTAIVNFEEKTEVKINTLQEKEAVVLPAPQKFKPTDPKSVALVQGPSLIGIHANANEDRSTIKFLNWYLNAEVDWKDGEKKTPAEYLAEKASYLLPFKKVLEKSKQNIKATSKEGEQNQGKKGDGAQNQGKKGDGAQNGKNDKAKHNGFVDIAVSQFLNGSVAKFVEPADFLGIRLRDAVKSIFNAAINNTSINFDKFIQYINDSLGSDFKQRQ